jgi:hypothetical protein
VVDDATVLGLREDIDNTTITRRVDEDMSWCWPKFVAGIITKQ